MKQRMLCTLHCSPFLRSTSEGLLWCKVYLWMVPIKIWYTMLLIYACYWYTHVRSIFCGQNADLTCGLHCISVLLLVPSISEILSALPSREFQLVDITHGFEVPGIDTSDAVLTNAFAVWIVAYSHSIIGDEFVRIPWWLPSNHGRHEILAPVANRQITIAVLKHKVALNICVSILHTYVYM